MAEQIRVFAAVGGGSGDLWFDYLRLPEFRKLPSLFENYNARIRIYSQCHCIGTATELFDGCPYIHEVIEESWEPPSPELGQRWNTPDADGYIPISRNDLLHEAGVTALTLQTPEIHLKDVEQQYLSRITRERPLIVVQPYAGLSDRDAFNPNTLAQLFKDIYRYQRSALIAVIGKNHERGHKYEKEICPGGFGNVLNLIDQLNIRVAYHLVVRCDAFVGAHSNLIRAAWDHRRRTAMIAPSPSLTDVLPTLDGKYTYGLKNPECKMFTYPFKNGEYRNLDQLDTDAIARFLIRG